MNFSFDSERPIFQQVAEWLENGIISGAFPEEERVPSITEFSTEAKINPATALKGINLLVAENILYKKRGLGMYVSSGAKEKLLQKHRENFYRELLTPLLQSAQQLGIDKQQLIAMIDNKWERNLPNDNSN